MLIGKQYVVYLYFSALDFQNFKIQDIGIIIVVDSLLWGQLSDLYGNVYPCHINFRELLFYLLINCNWITKGCNRHQSSL